MKWSQVQVAVLLLGGIAMATSAAITSRATDTAVDSRKAKHCSSDSQSSNGKESSSFDISFPSNHRSLAYDVDETEDDSTLKSSVDCPDCDQRSSGKVKAVRQQREFVEARPRRVNDDVSQCIQSYCGGNEVSKYRIQCIVKYCHRPSPRSV